MYAHMHVLVFAHAHTHNGSFCEQYKLELYGKWRSTLKLVTFFLPQINKKNANITVACVAMSLAHPAPPTGGV